jgi:hypothetical protein
MTSEEFNKKYFEYLEWGHYGLDIDIPELTRFLDLKFQEFIKVPGFQYSQIKSKFKYGRFYCDGIDVKEITEIEKYITKCLQSNAENTTDNPSSTP